ncbi:peptidase S41 family protein [Aspergillus sclerotiicarbonarius CBS 121057]|uniref:Peptidase S41 family protein n=1 Tax=Aspergillus sclerotiicarbonarius (strain CBS 121057 / IBT 28362) TaxID=1448318 RepID=A0A319EHG6_ASPSB|nr:peptidase S41 family protein [Aspergillus sclerotiicarbonarius CBS 121057]
MFSHLTTFSAVTWALAVSAASSGSRQSEDPCQQIARRYQQATNANATSKFVVPGELAHNCLLTMPFESEKAVSFVESLVEYLQWQSTSDVLKNPPSGYLSHPTDLLGSMEDIRIKAAAGKYTSQYEFDNDITRVFQSANDGHLSTTFCSQEVFEFYVNFPIVSVSSDGLQLPKLYTTHDAALLANRSTRVSPIATINGYDAVLYLSQLASTLGFQDPDARYNEMFPSAAREVALGVEYGAWTSNNGRWPGSSEFTVAFGNGSVTHVPTIAEVSGGQKFSYANGSSVYEAFCSPVDSSSSSSSSSTSSTVKTKAAPKTYPEPVMRDAYNLILGYYLNETDMQDVAVLFVPSFDTSDMSLSEPLAFANHATKFIQDAVASGKKKLIIDLTSNPGGTVTSGMDLFRLFFPQKPVYSSTRFRDHEVVNIVGQALNAVPRDSDSWKVVSETPFTGVTPNQTYAYKSWKEYSGPQYQLGANMSSLAAVSNLTLTSTWTTPVRGYGIVKQNMTSSPFAAENILMITDGFCSSTCTIFMELMKTQGGVKSLVFGGRPQYGPMAAMGGVRGGESLTSTTIDAYVDTALEYAIEQSEAGTPVISEQQIARLNSTPETTDMPYKWSGLELNFRNAYAPDNSLVPLQFVFDAADCRLFYTYENLVKPASTWVAAAKAYWGLGKCVPFSTGRNSTFSY